MYTIYFWVVVGITYHTMLLKYMHIFPFFRADSGLSAVKLKQVFFLWAWLFSDTSSFVYLKLQTR